VGGTAEKNYDFVDPTGHVNPASKEDIMLIGIKNYEKRAFSSVFQQ
jgi:hypothetical protein